MPFLAYLVAIAIAVAGVLIEFQWLMAEAPAGQVLHATLARGDPPAPPPHTNPSVAHADAAALTPIYPTSPREAETTARDDAPTAGSLARPVAETAAAPNHCDVNACASAYSSFRASDCTYQPYDGPRRLCGKVAQSTSTSSVAQLSALKMSPELRRSLDARAEARCNVDRCASTYQSFRASDCTYQPFDGGSRRLCER